MNLVLAIVCMLGLTCACDRTPPRAAEDTTREANRIVSKPSGPTRTEKDLLGSKEVPADAYYGVQTLRALENFKISGTLINQYPGFVEAWAIVKLAAARANTEVGAMKKERLDLIEESADRSISTHTQNDSRKASWIWRLVPLFTYRPTVEPRSPNAELAFAFVKAVPGCPPAPRLEVGFPQ